MAVLTRVLPLLFVMVLPVSNAVADAARLKDIADVEGVRGNQLFGVGVIVGLNGTGDGNSSVFTSRGVANLLERVGLRVDARELKLKNVATVMVTATLPPFAKAGSRLDVTLSSLGDAKSLQGGTLLLTPLRGADGNVYAVSQGSVTVGGFSVEGGGDAAQKNHPTVGVVAAGATVERSIPFDLFQSQRVRVVLRESDFTTVTRMTKRVNDFFGRPVAVAIDGSTVEIPLTGDLARDPIGMLAKIEQLEVEQDVSAKVVVNERTGTVIMGERVRLSRVALAHGNLNVAIRSTTQVSQPNALAERGNTEVISNTDITIGEEERALGVVGGEVTLGDLVTALNAIGATPRDLVSIFNALKRAGALKAELVIM